MDKKKNERTVETLKKARAKYNPRVITDVQLDKLKQALLEFGDLGGIVYNVRTGNLVGGNQRIKVIPKDAKIDIIERYETPTEKGTVAYGYITINGEKFNYREVDWDEKREKAANIAANAHGGEWDEEKLSEMFKELLQDNSIDIDLTGFSLAEIYRVVGDNPMSQNAEKLMILSEQLRKARDAYIELQKRLNDLDDRLDCYAVIVFRNADERKEFFDMLELEDNRYQDGRDIRRIIENLMAKHK